MEVGKQNLGVLKSGLLRLAVVFLLSGCAAGWSASMLGAGDLYEYFKGDTNLLERNYATADYLAERGHGFVRTGSTIKALPFLDSGDPRLVTKFGRELPEQIGERLNQLGYNVDLSSVSSAPEASPASMALAPMKTADFLLNGYYTRNASTVDVKIAIQEAGTGRERAAFQYSLPRHGNVREDTKPATIIEQMPLDSGQ